MAWQGCLDLGCAGNFLEVLCAHHFVQASSPSKPVSPGGAAMPPTAGEGAAAVRDPVSVAAPMLLRVAAKLREPLQRSGRPGRPARFTGFPLPRRMAPRIGSTRSRMSSFGEDAPSASVAHVSWPSKRCSWLPRAPARPSSWGVRMALPQALRSVLPRSSARITTMRGRPAKHSLLWALRRGTEGGHPAGRIHLSPGSALPTNLLGQGIETQDAISL